MARGFLDELLDATTEAESPKSFFYWSGLCALSSVVKNNVWLNRHMYVLYPNIYVLLFAKSGMRKGVPIAVAKRLVGAVDNTRVIAGRSSIQGVVKELGTARSKPDGTMLKDACGFVVSSEFASSLVQDPAALTILTDLYDSNYNEEWTNMLKGTPVEVLKNINVTLLGGVNQAHFTDSVPDAAIMGGFIGRTFVIYEEKKACINSLVYAPKRIPDMIGLAKQLKEISKIKGEFKFTPEGGEFFDDWYKTYAKKDRDDKTGTAERLHDSILKVSMLISASRKTDLTLDIDDLKEAIEQCMLVTASVKRATVASGKATFGPQIAIVLKELIVKKSVTRMRLLQGHYGDFDAYDLDRIIESLTQAGAVTAERDGRDIVYSITQKAMDQITKRDD
jgi:hypothetical protein